MAFEGFQLSQIDVGEASLRVRHGGSGPPLLLLHGHPETHMMWGKIADDLAKDFSVVAADLRGYGQSTKPPSSEDHETSSKRAMARDAVALMRHFGFERFDVAGHDRGARCAYRLALDHPAHVRKLGVLDVIPTGDAFGRADMAFGLGSWLWFFLAQPADLPERLIGADPRLLVDHMLDTWSGTPDAFPDDVRAEYRRAFANPATVHAICEEYRAAATLDRQHDEADRGRRRIACPTLVLWSARGALPHWYDVLGVWREWADDVRGRSLDCGHFLAEEAPEETFAALRAFFAG